MSWKSLVTAGLLCVLASPVFAAPTISAAKGGTNANNYLNANGDWVWNIQIASSVASTPLAAELGLTAGGSALKGASVLNGPTNFDTANPGKIIFGWEDLTAAANNNPVGLQSNCAAGCTESTPGTSPNTVFAALGSVDFAAVGAHDFIQIITAGPKTGALTSSLTVSGAYAGKGRIAELDGSGAAVNYDTYNNVFSRTAKAGDANLDGNVDGLDLSLMAANFGATSGKKWYQTDYNGDGAVDGLDLSTLAANFGSVGSPPGAGAGLGAGAVPEPASIALLGLAVLGGLGLVGRKR